MSKIAVLDKNMINMIAAGEVIERPASVLKEMLENSIDAGSEKIVVDIEEGGKKLISITDDGCGISQEDIPTAFEPHATSKIRTVEDLNAINSMGFRGEALASIGSVANVRIVSRTRDSIQANSMEIDCGEKSEVVPASGDYGTSIEVRDLFYKLPARRKFLRTNSTEMSHITEHFTRIALANCDIDLTLRHNSRQLYHLKARDNELGRISELIGKQISNDLISLETHDKGITVRAFIGKPTIARTNSKYQYIFLNKRYVRDKFILHAVKEAYRGLIEPNKYPVAFLFVEMPYESYDVNVHPTKVEVRFDNPNLVHSQILAALREKLLSLDLDVRGSLQNSNIKSSDIISSSILSREDEQRKQRIKEAMSNFFDQKEKPAGAGNSFPCRGGGEYRGSFNAERKTNLFNFDSSNNSSIYRAQNSSDFNNGNSKSSKIEYCDSDESLRIKRPKVMQIHDSYIVVEDEDGFTIIDQHALHERIIYEKLKKKILENKKHLESQKLLIPETIEVSHAQKDIIEKHIEIFKELGVEIEPFGPKTYAIHAFPVLLKKAEPGEFIIDLIDTLSDSTLAPDTETIIHRVLDMASCKAAIKAGQKLSISEMLQLLEDKDKTDKSSRCPHGRPTTIKFSIRELEKQFKRTGF